LAGIERGEARAFAGRVEFRGDENAVWRVVAASRLISPETQSAGIGEVAWCATANMMIERCLFMRLGAFDESLPFRLGGDDVDLGLRLRHSGNALRVLPDAVVLHPKAPWSDLKGIISRVWRWGRIEYHLALRHPNKVTVTPPFVAGTALTMGITCIAGAVLTGRAVLLAMLPVWLVISGLLFAWFSAGRQANGFITLYFAGWLERIYHLASACEHLRAGSIRFVWGGLILEDHLEEIFPAEPLQNWSNLLAAAVIAIMGAVIVAG
jgi:GT2 family glycosyltransferase